MKKTIISIVLSFTIPFTTKNAELPIINQDNTNALIDFSVLYPSELYIKENYAPEDAPLILNKKALKNAALGFSVFALCSQGDLLLSYAPLVRDAFRNICSKITIDPQDALVTAGLLAATIGIIPLYNKDAITTQKNVINLFLTSLAVQQVVTPGQVGERECRNAFYRALYGLFAIGNLGKLINNQIIQGFINQLRQQETTSAPYPPFFADKKDLSSYNPYAQK